MLRIRRRKLLFCYLTGGVKWEVEVDFKKLREPYCEVARCGKAIRCCLCLLGAGTYFS